MTRERSFLGMRARQHRALWVVALVLSACSSGATDDGDTTQDPAPPDTDVATARGDTAATTALTVPDDVDAATYDRPGEPLVVGSGFVEFVSADGSHVVVSQLLPGVSQDGCEGFPEPVLARVPTGTAVAPTDPEPVLPTRPDVNGTVVRFGDGRVIVVGNCEGRLDGLTVATEGTDGSLVSPIDVLPAAWPYGAVLSAWPDAERGTVLLLARAEAGGEDQLVVEFDPAGGPLLELEPAPDRFEVARLADGRLVLAGSGQIDVRGASGFVTSGNRVAVPPGGQYFAAVGPEILLVRLDGSEPEPLLARGEDEAPVLEAVWTPDEDALAFVASGEGGDVLSVITVTGAVTEIDRADTITRPAFSADGRTLAYNRVVADAFQTVVVTFA